MLRTGTTARITRPTLCLQADGTPVTLAAGTSCTVVDAYEQMGYVGYDIRVNGVTYAVDEDALEPTGDAVLEAAQDNAHATFLVWLVVGLVVYMLVALVVVPMLVPR